MSTSHMHRITSHVCRGYAGQAHVGAAPGLEGLGEAVVHEGKEGGGGSTDRMMASRPASARAASSHGPQPECATIQRPERVITIIIMSSSAGSNKRAQVGPCLAVNSLRGLSCICAGWRTCRTLHRTCTRLSCPCQPWQASWPPPSARHPAKCVAMDPRVKLPDQATSRASSQVCRC